MLIYVRVIRSNKEKNWLDAFTIASAFLYSMILHSWLFFYNTKKLFDLTAHLKSTQTNIHKDLKAFLTNHSTLNIDRYVYTYLNLYIYKVYRLNITKEINSCCYHQGGALI